MEQLCLYTVDYGECYKYICLWLGTYIDRMPGSCILLYTVYTYGNPIGKTTTLFICIGLETAVAHTDFFNIQAAFRIQNFGQRREV